MSLNMQTHLISSVQTDQRYPQGSIIHIRVHRRHLQKGHPAQTMHQFVAIDNIHRRRSLHFQVADEGVK